MSDAIEALKATTGVLPRRPFDITKVQDQIEKDMAQTRLPLLETREQTHGSFEDNAIISQAIKSFLRAGPGWNRLTDIEKEAMDMIALKFSRILSGKSLEYEHWVDCVGYSQLVVEKCVKS